MASINKSDISKDRKSEGGKGDLTRKGFENFRNANYWKRSECCNANVFEQGVYFYCKSCEKPCYIK